MKSIISCIKCTAYIVLFCPLLLKAQSEQDGLMMSKNLFCTGLMASSNSFTNYWEGTLKRNNANLGKVTSNMVSFMGNYGINDQLNLIFNLPYVSNRASAGTLHPMRGLQDASVWLKWMPLEKDLGKGAFSCYLLGGASTPLSNYIADFLPLSIGLKSKTVSGRLMGDYQLGDFFVTASATYTYRASINVERNAYYYPHNLVLSNQVNMPDASSLALRLGYRKGASRVAELLLYQNNTLGGNDIRRNDMPFPSYKMNSTVAGFNLKYEFNSGLSLIGNGGFVLAGRNVGQSSTFTVGAVYIFDLPLFSKKKKESDSDQKK